jgi:biopolymer transport protein ExbB/TolQ
MFLTDQLLAFTGLGAEWVLWLLVILSVVSVSIMIERWRYFASRRLDVETLANDVRAAVRNRNIDAAVKKWSASDHIAAIVAVAGLRESARGPEATAEAMVGARAAKRPELERNLAVLGTLGNNAPFIGLFATCIKIIQAFASLGGEEPNNRIMKLIAAALIATAVGIFVAIPAVAAFNVFQRRVRVAVAAADTVAHALLAELRGEDAQAAKKEAA